MNGSFANNLAAIFFLVCFAPAWIAWRYTRYLGTALASMNRLMQRLAFSASVFIGCFGCLNYAAWKFGLGLEWGRASATGASIISWLPLGMLLWAALTYQLLKQKTLEGGEDHEEPS